MKRILLFILLVVSFAAQAQITGITGTRPKAVYISHISVGDSVLTKDGNGYLMWIHKNDLGIGGGGMSNPMTTQGDIIYGGASGTPTRLAAGTSGYVLTSNGAGAAPSWQAASSGFSNPMTTQGDLIVGGSSGAAGRLAIGTANQLLRVNAGATSAEWFTPSYITGVTINSTSITSGTTNGPLFQNSSAQVSQDASNWVYDPTNNRMVIDGASSTTAQMVLSRNTTSAYPFFTLDDNNSAGFIEFGDGASTGFLPYIILKPDGTDQNQVILEARVNDSGTPAAVTFRATNYAGSGALSTKPLFNWDNNGTSAFKINADYSTEYRGKIKLYNNAAPTDGQILIGGTSAANFTAGTITAGAGISVTNGNNTITVASSNVEGTYTPTLTNTTNVAASTAYTTYYQRIGDVIHVWGTVDIDATAALTISEMGLSLPVASSVGQVYELSGTASFEDNTSVQIIGDVTNDRAKFRFTPQSATNNKYSFHFTYKYFAP